MGCPAMTGRAGRLWRGCISQSPHPALTHHESPTPTLLHFIHFVCPLRSAGKASKSSLYCTLCAQRLGLLSHFLDGPLDSGGGFVGIDANISIKQLLGTAEQSTQLFLVHPVEVHMMCDHVNYIPVLWLSDIGRGAATRGS